MPLTDRTSGSEFGVTSLKLGRGFICALGRSATRPCAAHRHAEVPPHRRPGRGTASEAHALGIRAGQASSAIRKYNVRSEGNDCVLVTFAEQLGSHLQLVRNN